MQKWFSKILLFLAVVTVVGHSSVPHHHHEQINKVAHHHHKQEGSTHHHHHQENKDKDHSPFSFAQLDENFVPVKFQHISIELPLVYLLTPALTCHINILKEKTSTQFGYYKEYPPPGNYLAQLPSRGPPSCGDMA